MGDLPGRPIEEFLLEDASTPKKSTTLITKSLGAIIGQNKTISDKRINAVRDCRRDPVWQ